MSQLRRADGSIAGDSRGDGGSSGSASDAPEVAPGRSAGAARADGTTGAAPQLESPGGGGRDEAAGTPGDGGRAEAGPTSSGSLLGSRRRTALTVGAITGVLAIPLVIAAIAVRSPHWYPLVDLAQIEMRVRDVGLSDPPLVGLGGRIFGHGTQGSHPGPISFYLLAPVYRLLGSTSWAMQASAATLNVAALAATVWAGQRRWGLRGALLMAACLAVLMRVYGTTVLLYPWNPYLPVLFWMLFLVCVWGVLCDDLSLLPVAVVAGSVCAQTHIPYLGLVGGMGAMVAGALVLAYRRTAADAIARRRLVGWTGLGLATGAVLWMPVFIEQLGGDPGNLAVILDSFRHPTDDPVGGGTAWQLLTEHLDLVRLVRGDRWVPASQTPGIVLLGVWIAAVVAAVRLRDSTLVRLHVVVGAALALGFVAISRIFGTTWFYLTLWAFGTAILTLLAVVATAGVLGAAIAARRVGRARLERFAWGPVAVLVPALLVPTALLARVAPDTEDGDAAVSAQLGRVVQPTVDAIEDGTVPGGRDGTHLMTWVDPVNLGGLGLGLMLELERRGYEVRAPAAVRLSIRDHRVAQPGEADAEIHVAAGLPAIDDARAHPGARQVAYHDPRTDAEIARYEVLHTRVVEGLRAAGLDELVSEVDDNLFRLAADDRVPTDLGGAIYAMGATPQPVAVFTWETAW